MATHTSYQGVCQCLAHPTYTRIWKSGQHKVKKPIKCHHLGRSIILLGTQKQSFPWMGPPPRGHHIIQTQNEFHII